MACLLYVNCFILCAYNIKETWGFVYFYTAAAAVGVASDEERWRGKMLRAFIYKSYNKINMGSELRREYTYNINKRKNYLLHDFGYDLITFFIIWTYGHAQGITQIYEVKQIYGIWVIEFKSN